MRIENLSFAEHNNGSLPHDLGRIKKHGWVFLNGNVKSEWDFIHFVNNFLHNPYHSGQFQNESRKVLVVTAGFEGGGEFSCDHIINFYAEHGIPRTWNFGQTNNIENLGVYHAMSDFSGSNDGYHVKHFFDFLSWMNNREDLNRPNSELFFKLHSFLSDVRQEFSSIQLYDLYYAHLDNIENHVHEYWQCIDEQTKEYRLHELSQFIQKYPEYRYYVKNIFDEFKEYDQFFFNTWDLCTKKFFEDSGIHHSHLYNQYREMLANRILSSASIFLWGGGWVPMLNAIKFFQLEPAFREAQARGSNFYGMSAGSIIMADRIYDLAPRRNSRGYIIPYTTGLGLFRTATLFTHIQDFDFIQNRDYDVTSPMSLRTDRPAIGLVRNSVALVSDADQAIFSVGADPVYLFDERGFYYYLNPGQHFTR